MKKKHEFRFGWRKYLDDYTQGAGGEYIYVGQYYRFFAEPDAVRRAKVLYCVFAAALAALFVAAGLNEYASGKTAYVVIPYVICVFPIAFLVMATVSVWGAPERMTRKQYDESVARMRWSSTMLLIASLAAVCGGAVFLIAVCPPEGRARETVFLLCCAGMAVVSGLWLWLSLKIKAGPENNQNGN